MVEKATSLTNADNAEAFDEKRPSTGGADSGVLSNGIGNSGISGLRPRAIEPLESGVFSGSTLSQSSSGELNDSVMSALRVCSEGDSELGALEEGLRESARALSASRDAQRALSSQLRTLHTGLGQLLSEKAALERYAGLLVQERDAALEAAEKARQEAKREREFLIVEQDRFIQLLLEEHEAELGQAREAAQRATALIPPSDQRPTLPPPARAGASGDPEIVRVPPSDQPGPLLSDEPKTLPPGARVNEPPLPSFVEQELSESRSASDASDVPPATVARVHLVSDPTRAEVSDERHEAGAVVQDISAARRRESQSPAPAVLDLESLEAEVDGNSERPPPICRLDENLKLHLAPAKVPTQLMDTLVSRGDDDAGDPSA